MSRKEILAVTVVSLGFYLAFFYRALLPQNVLYSGKDSIRLHYQTREFLHENITAGKIPFWTERMLMGFPIYADMERGVLNPINLLSIYLFGPVNSYKVLHILFYLMGSLSLYLLLRKDKQVILSFAAANAVYFFNFFVLFHQQHFNMVLTVYSLPALVLLLKKFMETPRRKILFGILFSMLFSTLFYFGSFQTMLINLIVLVWFLFSQGLLKKSHHPLHKLFFLFITILVLVLPGLWPQKGLYDTSLRSSRNVFYSGSVSAPVLLSAGYPFLFGSNDDYSGTSINGEYLMHEIYFYAGISALLIYFFGFLPLTGKRTKTAHLIIIVVTMFLMIWGQIPFFKNFAFPPFSLFRYWVRAVFLFMLPLSLGVGSYLANPKKIYVLSVLKNLSIPFLFIFTFGVLNYFVAGQEFFEISKRVVKKLTELSATNIFWWIFMIFTTFLLFFQKINMKTKAYLLVAVVTADMLVFGLVSNNKLIVTRDEIDFTNVPKSEKSMRILDLSKKIDANNSLTSNFWSVIGYSELIPSNTAKSIGFLELTSPRNVDFVSSCSRANSRFRLHELGVNGVIDESGVQVNLPGSLVETSNVESLDIEEGYIRIMKNQPDASAVATRINYYPGWLLYLDGKLRQDLIRIDQHGFINFTPDEKSSEIILRFVPIHLYQGVFLSVVVLWFLLGYGYIFRRKIFSE